jgi:hypothetical protein
LQFCNYVGLDPAVYGRFVGHYTYLYKSAKNSVWPIEIRKRWPKSKMLGAGSLALFDAEENGSAWMLPLILTAAETCGTPGPMKISAGVLSGGPCLLFRNLGPSGNLAGPGGMPGSLLDGAPEAKSLNPSCAGL